VQDHFGSFERQIDMGVLIIIIIIIIISQ